MAVGQDRRPADTLSRRPSRRQSAPPWAKQESRTRVELRQDLKVNNSRLRSALAEMQRRGLAQRGEKGWPLGQQQPAHPRS